MSVSLADVAEALSRRERALVKFGKNLAVQKALRSIDPLRISLPPILVRPGDFEKVGALYLPAEALLADREETDFRDAASYAYSTPTYGRSYLASFDPGRRDPKLDPVSAGVGYPRTISFGPAVVAAAPASAAEVAPQKRPWKRIKAGIAKRVRVNKQSLVHGGPEHFVVEFNGQIHHFEEVEILGKSKMVWEESTSYQGCLPQTKRSAWLQTAAAIRVR